eukprot:Opistho-1_new@20098
MNTIWAETCPTKAARPPHFLPPDTGTTMHASLKPLASAVLLATLGACAVGPHYERPTTPVPAAFKETDGWVLAVPADALDRGPWWALFSDPVLDTLAPRVEVSNQNVAAATAAYAQARALVREQRAGLFPTVNLTGGATHVLCVDT